jgi:hypothetical protein
MVTCNFAMRAGAPIVASAVLFHAFVLYGGNYGCKQSFCYEAATNAPKLKSASSTANATYLGKYQSVAGCEAACASYKVYNLFYFSDAQVNAA